MHHHQITNYLCNISMYTNFLVCVIQAFMIYENKALTESWINNPQIH